MPYTPHPQSVAGPLGRKSVPPKTIALRAFALIFVLCLGSCKSTSNDSWAGYTVGDFIWISAPISGRIEHIAVRPGEQVNPGDLLFKLESESESAQRDEAQAKLENAQFAAMNLDKGRRVEEIKVINSQLEQAISQNQLAQSIWNRQEKSFAVGATSQAELDDAKSHAQQSEQRVEELQASLRVAQLPARPDEINAAKSTVFALKNTLRQAQWALDQKSQSAQIQALVYELFFRVGEFVTPGQAVLSLLPATNIKVRFYVDEAHLPYLRLGDWVLVRCDGCAQDIKAKITRISTQAEYTPPVIYSNTQRAQLVFMVEAYPNTVDAIKLRPGQPIQVQPVGAQGE